VVHTVATEPDGTFLNNTRLQSFLGATTLSAAFTAAAAALGVGVVHTLTRLQQSPTGQGTPEQSPEPPAWNGPGRRADDEGAI
jgi:hypothetical protein